MNYIVLLLLGVFSGYYQPTETIDIKVTVTNINTLKGRIELGVFNDSKTFLRRGREYQVFSQEVTSNSMIFYLRNLDKGNYAISTYHDINLDKKCNLNILGRPTEPYGFSNNVKLKLFPPSFDNCKIMVDGDMSITIKLID